VVTRISIDILRSARVRREEYAGPWFPEPLLTDPYEDPERSAELADSLSMAALLLLERLSPLERAVFVLREVFGFGFPEIASAVARSEAACRQLAVRARRHMDAGRPRFEADRREREKLAARFFDALREGDVGGIGHGCHKEHRIRRQFLEAFEAAQREYDEVCEILRLGAPSKTVEVALQQRQLFNRFAREALDGSYDHDASYKSIVEAAQPVLAAMRLDLKSPE
jgi:hypothetical protein